MKLRFSLLVLFLVLATTAAAQSRPITAEEYEKVFKFAVSETNAAYPVIFSVATDFFENEKVVRTTSERNENESAGHRRIIRTTVTDGKTKTTYQVSLGFENVYCSEDGVSWKPSQYECLSGPIRIYGPRNPETVEYSVEEKTLGGKKVRVFREYSIFSPLTPNGKKNFRDKVSTIDTRGFFINIIDTEGSLGPRSVELVRKQSWTTKAKIEPIVAPIK